MALASVWFADGGVSGYDAATATLKAEKLILATNAAVDAQGVTRLQYPIPGGTPKTSLDAVARIRVEYDDYFFSRDPAYGGNVNNVIIVAQATVDASRVSAAPTVEEVWNAAREFGYLLQSPQQVKNIPVNAHVDQVYTVSGPVSGLLSANTKYWTALIPVQWRNNLPLADALPLYSSRFNPTLGGRAISVWTNRTPEAPVITSPLPNTVVAAGVVINLTVAKQDPDSIFGGEEQAYTDMAGVHVQYAARPTPDVPSPVWTDLPFADWGGALQAKGWWIIGSVYNLPGDGAATLAVTNTTPVLCGSNTPAPGYGLLPSGTWQIRVRAFDYGHPYPATHNPLVNTSGNYYPNNYPATNTSPWSEPVIVTVADQVPPPIPLWPIGHAAITTGGTVALSWQYRNTAVPPFAQAYRSIQIKKVSDADWTDLLINNASASQSYDVVGYSLVSGNQYMWRVKVTDTDGRESVWSEVAYFWMVPAPGSGGVRPIPGDTIDGATLGCGTHRVYVYRRGGQERVGEIRNLTYIEWNRVRDDISTAKIIVADWDIDCGNLLAQLQTWAYELVIFRENGYSTDRVWEGPISLLTYERDTVTIHAKDVMNYAYRRIIKQKMSDNVNGDTVTSRAARVLQNVFAPDDPNVLAYLTVLTKADDAMQYRSLPAFSRTAFEEVDDMAANAGLDYTAVGRSILLWGTKHRIGTLPEFRDQDLGSPPIVSEYGMSMANLYSVSDGAGIHGEANRLDEAGEDKTYGLVEMLSSSWASDSAPDSGTYTQEGLAKVIASFEGFAERSISERYPPPVIVRVPDNTTLNPDTVLSIQQLVPGVVIPLRSTGTLRNVVASQKLDAVKVIEEGDKEAISITLSPFSRDDGDIGEGGEGEGGAGL